MGSINGFRKPSISAASKKISWPSRAFSSRLPTWLILKLIQRLNVTQDEFITPSLDELLVMQCFCLTATGSGACIVCHMFVYPVGCSRVLTRPKRHIDEDRDPSDRWRPPNWVLSQSSTHLINQISREAPCVLRSSLPFWYLPSTSFSSSPCKLCWLSLSSSFNAHEYVTRECRDQTVWLRSR